MANVWNEAEVDTARQRDVNNHQFRFYFRYKNSYANPVMAMIHLSNMSPFDWAFAFEDAENPVPESQRAEFDVPASGTRVVFVKKCQMLRYFWRKKR